MRNALSSTTNRQIDIIEILRDADNFVPIKKITEKIDAVPKTILTNCHEINTQWGEIVHIDKNDLSELRLSEKDNRSVQEIFSKMIKESPSFQLLELLFFKPGKLRTDLEKELFLSSSSLYRRIVQLNKGLAKRGLTVDRTDLCISGTDELYVRLFMTGYFLEVYEPLEWPFQLQKEPLYKVAHLLNTTLKLDLTVYELTKLVFLIAVTLTRLNQGYRTVAKPQTKHSHKVFTTYQKALQDSVDLVGLCLTAEKFMDLFYTLFWQPFFGWKSLEEESHLTSLCDELLDLLTGVLKLTFSKKSRAACLNVLKTVYTNYKVYPHENYIAYNREYYNSLTIQKDFAIFSKVLEKALHDFERTSSIPWYSMYFNHILFEFFINWQHLPAQLDAMRQAVVTEVCSDLGIKHIGLLAFYLEKQFHEKVSLVVRPQLNCKDFPSDTFTSDLYITSFPTCAVPIEKLFVIADIPSKKDLTALGKKIDNIRRNKLINELAYLN
ncbi:helix-turn-helix domain-containing protein [Enterococcus hermanniensis]|uniref:Mga helix-turn-helix domain-containing protein n=1 Tax=Enterococcus hermanniensis TaxID=249189 RepID=A0A1L8TJ66_9ENTE|nr:helix-turn-helix domain-containing protein [Enterococcus hermanniensis]OJG44359.1 hypothetical protein RV04_GL000553 [Enterococcus hermanniensis]